MKQKLQLDPTSALAENKISILSNQKHSRPLSNCNQTLVLALPGEEEEWGGSPFGGGLCPVKWTCWEWGDGAETECEWRSLLGLEKKSPLPINGELSLCPLLWWVGVAGGFTCWRCSGLTMDSSSLTLQENPLKKISSICKVIRIKYCSTR